MSCFLGSYAVEVPYRRKDPEEEIDCPFQELRIIRHFRASGYYELDRRRKSIPQRALLYALQAPELLTEASTGTVDVTSARPAVAWTEARPKSSPFRLTLSSSI